MRLICRVATKLSWRSGSRRWYLDVFKGTHVGDHVERSSGLDLSHSQSKVSSARHINVVAVNNAFVSVRCVKPHYCSVGDRIDIIGQEEIDALADEVNLSNRWFDIGV